MANKLKISLWLASIPILVGLGIVIGYSQISDENCNTLESKLFNLGSKIQGWSEIGLNAEKVCNIAGYKIYVFNTEKNEDSWLGVKRENYMVGINKYSFGSSGGGKNLDMINAIDTNKDGRLNEIEYDFVNQDGRTGVVIDHGITGQLDYRLYDGEKENAEIWIDGKWRKVIRKKGINKPFVQINGKLVSLEPIMKNGISLGFRQKK